MKRGRKPLPPAKVKSRCIMVHVCEHTWHRVRMRALATGRSLSAQAARHIERDLDIVDMNDALQRAVDAGAIRIGGQAGMATDEAPQPVAGLWQVSGAPADTPPRTAS